MGFSTRQIHAGVSPDPVTGSILTPIYQSTTYVQPSVDEYLAKGYSYSRSGNPTVRALEMKLADLEGGAGSACFGTGMAAVQAVMLAFLNAGDHAVVSDVAYGGTYRLCTKVLNRFGVRFTFADTARPEAVAAAVQDDTRLIFTETPANPTMKLTDIAAISEIARQAGAIHAVDNTFLTPYYQRPLELGADVSVHSTTKYIDGHNATVGGAAVSRSAELDEAVRFIQNSTGTIMSPLVAWLTLQGCKTLSVRMERQSANALAIAQFLEAHPKVAQVCYPGLESFAQHELACRQASGFGAMLWFEVRGGLAAGKQLMDCVELWSLAENLGSVESLITHPVTMTHADVEPAERQRVGIIDGLVRLSVGLEDAEDLIGALDRALAGI
ncbi:MAG: aminotransferase class I/II-fold pyridoxal phosphate-dependent enzyme [Xanthomonadales bacterium]|nr:aminotransferase class I/II-fold pyridoxal phosphate-dependent enzyme [Xanthomonadales bacterium]NIN60206.1 aminotransferase class I/II-fold pyridoxal phosphate-dependent enzyme [Xanthomonadales bacterium]NIN75572.1 aminotransferase class I/II-fold pyridoxal phosphate-dependent enzyme [Xanthomonadales bacterium]NIO13018.1 aminotransferase class I/II-fold pyridoxal phosphate-dependent enzyme [Xanthomonadales bacterium]NIP12599.1 aminotransferase class I/II-fold pyridoxal phosphate-dependent e